ncbi:ATP-binding protein [Empedobacter falsenii]
MEINSTNHIDVLRIGIVFSVKGRSIEILVDKTKNVPHLLFNGELIRNVSVGSYIKINKGFERIIGIIESETIKEDKLFDIDNNYNQEKEKIQRVLQVKIVGYLEHNSFEQGVKELPLIDNVCYILTKEEYDQVHAFIKNEDTPIAIGTLASETSKEISLGVNSLFASHIGIFGNTGSGKSYSLASLYHSLFEKFGNNEGFKKNAKFLLIDFNGEYISGKAISSNKEIYNLTSNNFNNSINHKIPISLDLIKDVNFWSIILKASEQTQKPFLESTFKNGYLENNISTIEGIKKILKSTLEKIFTQVTSSQDANYHISFLEQLKGYDGDLIFTDIDRLIDFYKSNIKFWSDRNTKRYDLLETGKTIYSDSNLEQFILKAITEQVDILNIDTTSLNEFQKIRIKIIINLFYCIQKGFYNREHISPLLNRLNNRLKELNSVFEENITELFRQNNFVVISLKEVVSLEVKKIIPLVISKDLYETQKKINDKSKFLNIIIDEAHNILSHSSNRESESWKDYRLETFEEIIKEGRKFGTFLTIASQRPSDISSTIISQLHNYFLHRLINNKDIEAIEKTVSYLDKVSFESLPILPTGTSIIAGLAAKLPVVVKMNELDEEFQPNSQTIKLTDFWGNLEIHSDIDVDSPTKNDDPNNEEDDDLPF